jgi:hypothetical protein
MITSLPASPLLRRALVLDAVVTGACALPLAFGGRMLAGLLGLPASLLTSAGVGLIVYTAFLVWLLRRDTLPRGAVWFVIAGNALWAIDSVLLLFTNWIDPTVIGQAFVVFQAVVVAVFAEAQYVGLRRTHTA